ncbi:MAG: hypothetical protein RLZ98_1790 [Pseudomonadota bacterium]|jgi:hypothetical protein
MQKSEPSGHQDAGPLGPGAVRALKIVIVVMGVMIFAGLALVAARIIQLSSTPRTETASATGTVTMVDRARIAVPAGATIRNVALSGQRLVVHYDAPTSSGILIMDTATGKTLSRIDIVPEPPSN